MYIKFMIPGRAVPAVRTTQRQKFTDLNYQRYLTYKHIIGFNALNELKKSKFSFADKGKEIEIEVKVYLATRHRCDVDNLLKSFMDGLNNVLWCDDSQVMKATVEKIFIKDKDKERSELYIKVIN